VIVNDFDLEGIAIPPLKADPILVNDTQAPLSFPIAFKLLQSVSRRFDQLLDCGNGVNLAEFAQRDALKRRISATVPVMKDFFRFLVDERTDHA
jgi:hypothetical protein